MRARLGLLILAVITTLLAPISPQSFAFGGFASAPLNVTDSAIAGGVRVSWSAPTDVDTGVTGYRVEYSTTGTNGNWSLATTVSSSTYTYDILGLAQVATYVRVAATTAGGVGIFGYPWELIYSTSQLRRDSLGNVSYDTGYGLSALGSQASNTYGSASFTRVKYRLDTTISSAVTYAEADFYKWPYGGAVGSSSDSTEPTIAGIAVPSVNSGQQWIVQTNVSDMNVYSSNASVTKAIGTSGRLEIWPWDYSWGPSTLTPAGSSNSYDFGDTHNGGGSYGSFQVHDITNDKPVFVWNNTGYSNYYSAEVAYGKNSVANPDWTFCSQAGSWGSCSTPSAFKLRIYINPSVTPLAENIPPVVSRIDAKTTIKSGDTISVRSNELGTVYLVRNTVAVSNSASLSGAAANVRNSVSITSANTTTTLTTSGLLDGTYNLYAVDSVGNVSTGILNTLVVDTTPPVANSFSVNSTGDAILMTIGESSTLSSFASGAYTVSDSGSAISVTSATISALVVTLNLSRAIPAGAYVTFAYTPANVALSGRWVDAAGNQLDAVSLRNITNNSTTPISVQLSVPSTVIKGNSITVTATVSVSGNLAFSIANKRIPGCLKKVASGTTPISVTCTFKPALSANQTIRATLTPTLGNYPTTTASVTRYILKRSNSR